MHTQTLDRQAFELVVKAMERLDDYNRERQLSRLEEAESALNEAVKRDAQYLDASLYAGIVKDLIGKAADAVPFFDKILNNLPRDSEHRRYEVQYSRGVAWYHQYGHGKLAKAEQDFLLVVEKSSDIGLTLLARAGLAQTYAMWMIPSSAQKERLLKGQATEELQFIEAKRNQCLVQIKIVNNGNLARPGAGFSTKASSLLSGPIQGTILNAHGMCTMYWTDYNVKESADKYRLLREAIDYLEEADEYLPGDWANTCDIGSAHLRLAVVIRESGGDADPEFHKALKLIQKVIDDLRPGYGFAFYEKGRIYRISQRFEEAKTSLEKSLEIPAQYRDVRDQNVEMELNRVEQRDSTFP